MIPTIARTELGWLGGPLTWDAARHEATGRGRDPVRAVGDTFVVHVDREALNDYPVWREADIIGVRSEPGSA